MSIEQNTPELAAQLWEMKQRACRAHALCNELRLAHPEIPELGDDGVLHEAIHDILRVDTPTAAPAQAARVEVVARPCHEAVERSASDFLKEKLGEVPAFQMAEDGDENWSFWVTEDGCEGDTTSYVHADLSIEWYGTAWEAPTAEPVAQGELVTLREAAEEALGLLEHLDPQHGMTTQLRDALAAQPRALPAERVVEVTNRCLAVAGVPSKYWDEARKAYTLAQGEAAAWSREEKSRAFEWLRSVATADDAPAEAGIALDTWHALATTPPAEIAEFLKDSVNVHAMMLRGAIAIPSIRSMVDLRGEVPNGEDVQLARIAELQEQLAALKAQPAEIVVEGWQPIETAPQAKSVLVAYVNECGKARVVKARFIARFTELSDEDTNNEVNPADDNCYTLEGWYEEIDNWDEYSGIRIHHELTHWAPLPGTPTLTAAQQADR